MNPTQTLPKKTALPLGLSLNVWLALLIIWIVWGSTYLAIRIAVATVPPFLLISTRFLLAGLILFLFAKARGAALPSALQWCNAAIIGGLLLGCGVGGTAYSEQNISSSLTTIIIAGGSIVNVLMAGLINKTWPRRLEWLGIAIGLAGVALLAFDGDLRARPLNVLIQLFALTCWATGSALSSKLKLAEGAMGSASEMLAGGALLFAVSMARGDRLPAQLAPEAFGAWVYLVLFGSVIAYSAYMHVLKHARPALATSYSYVNPLVAIVLGFAVLNERVSAIAFVSAGFIITGVLLMSLMRSRSMTNSGQ
jgi:drug/metabolite transporter (DMT)-like permease